MYDEGGAAGRRNGLNKLFEEVIAVLIIDADTRFHRDWQIGRCHHGEDFGGDQIRFGHQAGAEAA